MSQELCFEALLLGALFPNVQVFTAYGMTEACSSLTYCGPMTPTELLHSKLSVGFPIPGTQLSFDPSSKTVVGSLHFQILLR